MPHVPYLNRQEVLRLGRRVDIELALELVLKQAARGIAGQHVRTELAPEGLGSVLGIMPAYRAADSTAFSAKVVCVVPSNPQRGLPAHQGMVMLFDAREGHLRALAEAGAVTELRTAALTALATKVLAVEQTGPHLILGAGHQAEAHIRALHDQGRALHLWSRRPEQARNLAAGMAQQGIHVKAVTELEPAVRQSRVITTVTGTSEPFLKDEWLQPGTHLNAIGSSTPRVSEVPEQTLRTATVFVDDIAAVSQLSGEMQRLGEPLPYMTELGEVLLNGLGSLAGTRSRSVFKSVGVPVQDLALMQALIDLMEQSSSNPSGQTLEL